MRVYRVMAARRGFDSLKRSIMRYVKISHMGVSSVMTLMQAREELNELYANALSTDVLELRFVEMSESDFEKLDEFRGY
jgi:hypothetical protein